MQKHLMLQVCLAFLMICSPAMGKSQDGADQNREQILARFNISEEVYEYAMQITDLMKEHSAYTGKHDWDALRMKLFEVLHGTQEAEDVGREAIVKWLRQIDNHSWFYRPKPSAENSQGNQREVKMPSGHMLPEQIAYVNVPYFLAGDPALGTDFADTLHELVRSLDEKSPKGWIIDLRENIGGNMYPMLSGMGAFYRERIIGKLAKADNHEASYYFYDAGASGSTGRGFEKVVTRLSVEPYSIKTKDAPIAVLIGKNTASAGEGLLVALLGLPNIRTFGQATGGYVAANMPYKLSDGAMLGVAQSFFTDIRGNVYTDSIKPQTGVKEAEEGDQKDNALELATLWILNR